MCVWGGGDDFLVLHQESLNNYSSLIFNYLYFNWDINLVDVPSKLDSSCSRIYTHTHYFPELTLQILGYVIVDQGPQEFFPESFLKAKTVRLTFSSENIASDNLRR